jgi:hypothetical protein
MAVQRALLSTAQHKHRLAVVETANLQHKIVLAAGVLGAAAVQHARRQRCSGYGSKPLTAALLVQLQMVLYKCRGAAEATANHHLKTAGVRGVTGAAAALLARRHRHIKCSRQLLMAAQLAQLPMALYRHGLAAVTAA